VIDWDAVDMAVERGRQEFERRLEKGLKELNQRLAKVERRWEKEEEERRREWEALAGRLMTAEEKSQHYHDGLLRKMAVMTNMQVGALREHSEEMRKHFEESRAEWRATREATLKMMDRLPPG
jgi:phage/plasmid-associated DNA primase